jgi:gliding motility-associated lipoprotein GldH
MFFLLASCTNNSIYRQNKQISDNGWHKDSIVQFAANITDTVKPFDIYISTRNTNAYPRQNLFLFVKTTSPQGNFVVDTINILLADDYGQWTGKRISRIWENRFLFRKNVKFANKGNYKFAITQGMRYDVLEGISDVAVNIEHYKDIE